MGDSVVLAYLHDLDVAHSWHTSYVNTIMYDVRPGGPGHLRGGHIAHYGAPLGFDDSRNAVVRKFLEDFDADWLWWVDSDMGWPPDALEQLMEVADPVERPIVGGLCFAYEKLASDGCNGHLSRPKPTLYMFDETDTVAGVQSVWRYPVNELVRVGATGSAFVLIHRSVFERMAEAYGQTWYDRLAHPKNVIKFGEDISFCIRAANLDIPVHVHTGVRTNHHKDVYVSEANYFQSLAAPPADELVTVIVPVIDRPQNAEPLMRSIRATTSMAQVIAVCESDDVESQDAWLKAGAYLVLSTDVKSFADKVNEAYQHVDTPWFFLTGDDTRFHPGWFDEALLVARLHNCSVVGTNDLFNPRVMDGDHATHMLIRTDYVAEQGASWDGPGVVCHGGYRHWYVDDEIVTVAKQRHTFTVALGSIVEHLHPLAGKADDDEVYRKGQRHAEKDRALFLTRLATHGKQVAA